MTTVPTELLRTLIAVVELRSFTKAAQSLGVTQPAVSAQIKRLQQLLGADLFDKSAPGITLTEKGEQVVGYARRLLAINDRILHLAVTVSTEPPIRIGMPGDFGGTMLPGILASFRSRHPALRFQARGDTSENLLRDLQHGQLDLVLALTEGQPLSARHHWREELAWALGDMPPFEGGEPLKLVTLGEGSVAHKLAVSTLNHVGCDYDIVYSTFSQAAVIAAVEAGLGVALMTARTIPSEFKRKNERLPKSPDMWCGVYLREGIDRQVIEELADTIANALRPRPEVAWSADPAGTAAEPTAALRASARS